MQARNPRISVSSLNLAIPCTFLQTHPPLYHLSRLSGQKSPTSDSRISRASGSWDYISQKAQRGPYLLTNRAAVLFVTSILPTYQNAGGQEGVNSAAPAGRLWVAKTVAWRNPLPSLLGRVRAVILHSCEEQSRLYWASPVKGIPSLIISRFRICLQSYSTGKTTVTITTLSHDAKMRLTDSTLNQKAHIFGYT